MENLLKLRKLDISISCSIRSVGIKPRKKTPQIEKSNSIYYKMRKYFNGNQKLTSLFYITVFIQFFL